MRKDLLRSTTRIQGSLNDENIRQPRNQKTKKAKREFTKKLKEARSKASRTSRNLLTLALILFLSRKSIQSRNEDCRLGCAYCNYFATICFECSPGYRRTTPESSQCEQKCSIRGCSNCDLHRSICTQCSAKHVERPVTPADEYLSLIPEGTKAVECLACPLDCNRCDLSMKCSQCAEHYRLNKETLECEANKVTVFLLVGMVLSVVFLFCFWGCMTIFCPNTEVPEGIWSECCKACNACMDRTHYRCKKIAKFNGARDAICRFLACGACISAIVGCIFAMFKAVVRIFDCSCDECEFCCRNRGCDCDIDFGDFGGQCGKCGNGEDCMAIICCPCYMASGILRPG